MADQTAGIETDTGDAALILELRSAVENAFDLKQVRIAMGQRGADGTAIRKLEDHWSRQAIRLLRKTRIGPWLVEQKTSGLYVARVVALIADPWRFPGQKCSEGHIHSPIYEIGSQCPSMDRGGVRCPGAMQSPRTTTGTRSIWHWAGLHVVNGKLPMRRKGVQADWNPKVRTSFLMPDVGIAAQIVRLGSPYRAVYDAAKERLTRERGIDVQAVSEAYIGPADSEGAEAETGIEKGGGALRPFQIEDRARIITVKALLGDMLQEWKRRTGPPAMIA